MNGMRKVLCFLMAMMLAAVALPGIAGPAKSFSANVSPLQVQVGTSNVTAGYANTSPTVKENAAPC